MKSALQWRFCSVFHIANCSECTSEAVWDLKLCKKSSKFLRHGILKRFQFPFLGHFIPFGAMERVLSLSQLHIGSLDPRMGCQLIAAFGDLGLCSRVPWCSEDVLTAPPATRWTRGLNGDPSLFRRDRAEDSVLFVKLATEINKRISWKWGTWSGSHLGWVTNWNGWDPTFRSKNRSGLSHWGYGGSFQRKYLDPEPDRCAQIFKLKRLKGRGLASKHNTMSERRRGSNLPGQILPVLDRENCRTWPSWGR